MNADKELLARLRGLRNEHAEGTEIHEAFDAAIQRIERDGRDAEDAARYRWLCADLETKDEREHRDKLFSRMGAMSISAVNEFIDAALAEKGAGK